MGSQYLGMVQYGALLTVNTSLKVSLQLMIMTSCLNILLTNGFQLDGSHEQFLKRNERNGDSGKWGIRKWGKGSKTLFGQQGWGLKLDGINLDYERPKLFQDTLLTLKQDPEYETFGKIPGGHKGFR